MCNLLRIICALAILACPAIAQNEIDHIATYYPSGYGKLAIDGDTLYVNVLFGNGVERYDIADPANPVFIDREEVSGFDQIDFERRLMAKSESGQLLLTDFSNFNSVTLLSQISLLQIRAWKLAGNYLFIAAQDSIRVYNISDPANPSLCDIIQANTTPIGGGTVFGSTVCLMQYDHSYSTVIDYYDISEPNYVYYTHSDSVAHGPASSFGIGPASGDTMFAEYVGQAGYSWQLYFISFAPNDTNHFPSWGEGHNGHPRTPYSNDNSFLLDSGFGGVIAYSFNNFYLLGIGPPLWDPNNGRFSNYNFDCTQDNNFIVALAESLAIYQPTHDSTSMPQIGRASLNHFGILSSVSYGDYILSGAESNGGELLVHHLNQSNDLDLVSTVPGVPAKNIIIDGVNALCLCQDKIVQVDISNPASPFIRNQSDNMDRLIGFAKEDSLISIYSYLYYYLLSYDPSTGFRSLSRIGFHGDRLKGIAQYQNRSFLLEGDIGKILIFDTSDPSNPQVLVETNISHPLYQFMTRIGNSLWASGPDGTDIISADTSLNEIAFLGPEYYSDLHQIYASADTLYAADGINGIRMFTFPNYPYAGLHYIGGYSTGNVVNQIATIGDNFFVSDYYSLQHLRWGAPTGVEEPESPHNMPTQFALLQNYPNPFNSATTIRYNLPENEKTTLTIFDITGRQVCQLPISGSSQEIVWDGADDSGRPAASGLYFYTIDNHGQSARRMVLLR
jgi:hypothetical protein